MNPAGFYADKLIVVTGASSGIGRAMARQFARRGAAVAMIGRDPDRLNAAVQTAGKAAKGYELDLTRLDAIGPSIKAIESDFGRPIDMLVHAAGTASVGRVEDTPVAVMLETVVLNLVAAMGLANAVAPGMRAREAGKLVFITSGAATFGVPGEAAYSASKSGLERLAESLRIELAGSGITVCVVSPGPVETPLMRNPRVLPRRLIRTSRRKRLSKASHPMPHASNYRSAVRLHDISAIGHLAFFAGCCPANFSQTQADHEFDRDEHQLRFGTRRPDPGPRESRMSALIARSMMYSGRWPTSS